MLSIQTTSLHLCGQGVIDRVWDGKGKGPLQGFGLARPFQTVRTGAKVSAAPGFLSVEIQGDLSLRGADHADQLPFWLHFPAAEALAQGIFLASVVTSL